MLCDDEDKDNVKSSSSPRTKIAGAHLRRLADECAALADLLTDEVGSKITKVPTVRYGRTELQMPVVSLGCMRSQHSWNSDHVRTPDRVDAACQDNLVRILRHAVRCGVRHVETARGYGCSEFQLGLALRALFNEGACRREDLILQTKSGMTLTTTKAEYKSQILEQIRRLGVDYVDLFSVHGINTDDHYIRVALSRRRGEGGEPHRRGARVEGGGQGTIHTSDSPPTRPRT